MARKPDIGRRRDIAARAFEILRARGVHRTTMSDLATALGIKRPTLYFYFRDLGEIFDAVVEDHYGKFMAFVAGRLADCEHPIDYLEALIRAVFDFHDGRRDVIILLFQMWAVGGSQEPERVIERGRSFVDPMRKGLIERVRAGVADGRVRACDPVALVDLTLATTDGALVSLVTRGTEPRAMADAFCTHVLLPLKNRESAAKVSRKAKSK